MSQPRRWWIGILPLLLIWLLANRLVTPVVEQDIALRTAPAIRAVAADIIKPEIGVEGRDVTLTGTALRQDTAGKTALAAENVQGVRLVHTNIGPAQVERPYVLAATRDGNAVTLTGFAPTSDAKGKLLAAAKSAWGNATVAEDIKLGAGSPSPFDALAAHGFSQLAKLVKGRFALSDLTYSLEGVAADSKAYQELARLASALPQGAKPGTISITAPPVAAYRFAAVREGDTLTLSGFVTSLAERERILAAARAAFPGMKIVDELAFASNAPGNFAAIVEHGLAVAGKLLGSRFELSGNSYALSGAAGDHAGFDAANASLRALPQGAASGRIAILPPEVKPYSWSARLTSDGRLLLEGHGPDDAALDAILAEARKLYPNARIENAMRIARTAPEGFGDATRFALAQLAKLKTGEIRFADANLSVSGDAADPSVASAIEAALRGLKGLRLAAYEVTAPQPAPPPVAEPQPVPAPEVRLDVPVPPPPPLNVELPKPPEPPPPPVAPPVAVAPVPVLPEPAVPAPVVTAPVVAAPAPPPPAPSVPAPPVPQTVSRAEPAAAQPSCAASGGAPLLRRIVLFGEASATLESDQQAVLKDLIDVLKRCPAARAYLAGHTNSHGGREPNIRLSSRRAFAASRWLQQNGIPKRRIETLGFGEDRLLMSEASAEGVTRNRRVEITIR